MGRTLGLVARVALLLLVCTPTPAAAQITATDLAGVSLEELMNVRVTVAARKAQPVEEVPAAIYVVTREDIRRSGLTSLPEIFRLVPGMQVARINANKWAVSIRGFNNLYANKALILIDGRSIYNRVFSGVFWEAQALLVADIERIEVVRGPGSAVWGSNAVNGIINIITRSAADTKGALVDLSAGTFERFRASVRYGGSTGRLNYRVYSQWSDHTEGRAADGSGTRDDWNSLVAGYRTDWTRGRDELTTQAQVVVSESRPNWVIFTTPDPAIPPTRAHPLSEVNDLSLQGRWTRSLDRNGTLIVQSFFSRNHRDEVIADLVERTADLDVQYQARTLGRHAVVFGGGYRHAQMTSAEDPFVKLGNDRNNVINVYLQDEVRLHRAVTASLGSKFERDTNAGWGWLPSARVIWHWPHAQHVWAGLAKARRTPSTLDRYAALPVAVARAVPLPIATSYLGNPDLESEELWQADAGYRVSAGGSADLEVATFYGRFDQALNTEAIGPSVETMPLPHLRIVFQPFNRRNVTTRGVEVHGRWAPFESWRLNASYSGLWMRQSVDLPAGGLTARAAFYGNSPRHQWQVHSSVLLPRRVRLDGAVYGVGRLTDLGVGGLSGLGVARYLRVDAGFEVPLTARLSLLGSGQNLSRATHQEYVGALSLLRESLIPRSARISLRWQY